jgi:hypothetical protein
MNVLMVFGPPSGGLAAALMGVADGRLWRHCDWDPCSSAPCPMSGAPDFIWVTGSRSGYQSMLERRDLRGFEEVLRAGSGVRTVVYVSSSLAGLDDEALPPECLAYRDVKRQGEGLLASWCAVAPGRCGIVLRPGLLDTEHVRQSPDPVSVMLREGGGSLISPTEVALAIRELVDNARPSFRRWLLDEPGRLTHILRGP